MKSLSQAVLIIALVTYVHSAPQFISFTDGKLGVNFGGYHAAVGLGGNGASGGLFAEAGTPHGQSAKAGLGGGVNSNGGTSGGLYAGATAGGNVQAAAGLAGTVNEGTSVGTGFASAQAGNHVSSSSMNGIVSSHQLRQTGYKRPNNVPQNVPFTSKTEDANEIKNSLDSSFDLKLHKSIKDQANYRPLNTETQNVELPIAEASVIAKTPQNSQAKISNENEFKKSALDNVYASGQKIEKFADIGSSNNNDGLYTRTEIKTSARNPTFFEDIFNIPIAALTAVRTFLTNTAGNTSVSVQKSGSIQAGFEPISSKHASPSLKSSDTQISVQTPNASQLFDDILAIPINTLGAVNKFLENNVPPRKRVSVTNGQEQFARNIGPHARRRALRKGIMVESSNNSSESENIQ